jgi:HEAT repeat protein
MAGAVICVAATAYAQDQAVSLDQAFKDAAVYQFGGSRLSLTVISDAVRDSYGKADARKDLVNRLVALVESPIATVAGKDFACRELSMVGGEEVVPAVAKLLGSKDTANLARYALERIPGNAADQALLAALSSSEPAVKTGIINSLGQRKAKSAIAPLAPMFADADAQIAKAALAAVAKIGGADAAKVIAAAKGKLPEAVQPAWADAYLFCADGLVASGDAAAGTAIYKELSDKSQPERIQVAAFRGTAKAAGDGAVELVATALQSGNVQLQGAATEFVRNMKTAGATAAFAAVLPKLDAAGQVLLISALADRGDAAAFDAVNALIASQEASVRVAAIAAMGKVGNAGVVAALAAKASGDVKEEAVAARSALDIMRGENVDAAIVAEMEKAAPAPKGELVRSLAARNAVATIPAVMKAAQDADESVREEAFKALGTLASAKELPVLVDMLVKVQGGEARREAEKAVVQVAKTIEDPAARGAAALAALPAAKEAVARGSLYNVLSQVGDPNGLAPVMKAAQSAGSDEEKDFAIRAMANWPDSAAIDNIIALCADGTNDTQRTLLLRGALKLLETPGARAKEQIVGIYKKTMDLAKSADEKKMVLGALPNAKDVAALAIAQPCASVAELADVANVAIQKIKVSAYTATASANEGDAMKALDNVLDTRWTTGANQAPGQWFQIDQGAEYEVGKVILDASRSPEDYPRGYQVFVSTDTANWGNPVAEGNGTAGVTEITCTPKKGRFVKIVQTQTAGDRFWSINEARIDSK